MSDTSPSTSTTGTSPTGTAPFGDDDPRAIFARAVALGGSVIDAVPPDHLGRPTPCPGMAVGELLEHLVMVLRRVACAGRGDGVETWPVDAADAAGRWGEAWREAAHDVQAAWGDDVLTRPTQLPWGTFPGAAVLDIYTNEVTVHTWDLAQATDQRPAWDEAVVAAADAAIRDQLPLADRTPMWAAVRAELPPDYPWEDPFGPAVEVPADAEPIERLVAWNGRTP